MVRKSKVCYGDLLTQWRTAHICERHSRKQVHSEQFAMVLTLARKSNDACTQFDCDNRQGTMDVKEGMFVRG